MDSLKLRHDRDQLMALLGVMDVIDVYEGDYISDRTGKEAILVLKRTLGLIESPNPLTGGNAHLVRGPSS